MVTAADRAAATVQLRETMGYCEGGGFSKRSPSPGPPPEEWLGIGLSFLADLRAHAA